MFTTACLVTRRIRCSVMQKAWWSSSPSSSLIVNAVGDDRLGIVSDITGMVIACGGNVGESQAARLGPHFTLTMLVDVPAGQLPNLQQQLAAIPNLNATVFESNVSHKTAQVTPHIGYSAQFNLEGADNPGIVHKITTALTKHGLSIEKLQTDQDIAPHGGSVLFKMSGIAIAAAPLASGFDPVKIANEMQELGEELNCDVSLEEMEDGYVADRSACTV